MGRYFKGRPPAAIRAGSGEADGGGGKIEKPRSHFEDGECLFLRNFLTMCCALLY